MNLLNDKVSRLYSAFAISALGSTLITNIYSIVDTVCVGQYAGDVGAAAISCLNPLWPIMLCIGIMAGLGGSVMMNNRRGAGDERSANEFFTVSVIFSLVAAIGVFILFVGFTEPLLIFFGAKDPLVLSAAMEYARVIAFVSPLFTVGFCLSAFIRNDGEAKLPFFATVFGGIVNVICDVLFVFDFGLGLGMTGAALATALGQITSFSINLTYFFSKKCKLKFTKIAAPFKKLLHVAAVGASDLVIEVSTGTVMILFNNALDKTHQAIYSTASSLLILSYCFFYALGNGLQPIVSANFGANKSTRVLKTLKITLIYAGCFGVFFTLLMQLFPRAILNVFMETTDEIMAIGPDLIRIYTAAMIIVGIGIIATYFLQSTLHKLMAFAVSLLRGLVLPIILIIVLPIAFSSDAIWWCIPISEVITAVVAAVFVLYTIKKLPKDKESCEIAEAEEKL